MKKVTSLIFMMLMLSFFWTTNAQVSSYTFTGSSGTYTPITGGTVHATAAWDDTMIPSIALGFTFVFDGNAYTSVTISPNGYVIFGGTASLGYGPISSTTAAPGCAAALGRDLQGNATSEIRSETIGSAGNYIFVVQWTDARRYGSSYTDENFDMQIKLLENGNKIQFVYGEFTGSAYASPVHPQVGLRGATNAAFANRTTTSNWAATTAGVLNTDVCKLTNLVFPANGQTFTYSPPLATAPGLPNTPNPANLATGVSTTPVLTWNFGLNTSTYDLYFGTDNPPLTKVVSNAAAGATGTYTPGTLSYSTPYYWYVVAKNASDLETVGPLWSFTTACPTVNAPFTENFTIWPPSCWGLTGGTYSWVQYAADPLYCAKANFWSQTSGNTDVMTTPPINIAALGAPNLKFDWSHLYSSTYPLDALTVYVSDNYGSTWTQVWYKGGADLNSGDGAGNTTPGTFVSTGNIDLSAFGDIVLVKFYGYSGYGPDLYVDNVTVYEPAFGTLAGTVTSATSKGPIAGAVITAGTYSGTTNASGFYSIPNMAVGTYSVTCSAEGYFSETVSGVAILVNQTTTQNFALGFAQIHVTPASLTQTLLPNGLGTQTLTISNPSGTEPLTWSASIVEPQDNMKGKPAFNPNMKAQQKEGTLYDDFDASIKPGPIVPTDAMYDVLGSFTVGTSGNYAAASDGEFIYVGLWNANQYDKYSLDGTFIESFSITGAGTTRDLAFDGQYFYGSPISNVIYQMDFTTHTLVSTITVTPSGNTIRGIAYDAVNDAFWVTYSGWNAGIKQISRTGATLQTLTPAVSGVSGLAWENISPGGPYLWAYTPTDGTGTHILNKLDITTGATLESFNMSATGFPFSTTGSGGGLEITDLAVPGKWAFLGVAQNEFAWLLELADAGPTWLSLGTTSGTVNPGQSQVVNVNFDATGLVDSTFHANINISHNGQQVTDGTIVVPATLIVASNTPPIAPTLVSPAVGATLVPLQPSFNWINNAGTSQVQIEIKRGTGPFSVTVHKSLWMNYPTDTYNLADHGITLLKKQAYTWLVRAKNAAGIVASGTRTFTTIGAGTVGGVVTDAYTTLPLQGATITIQDMGLTATTAADGSYTIANVLEGTHNVIADLEGYVSQTKSATVVHNQLALINFALNEVLDTPVGLTADVEDFVNVNLQWHEPGYTPPTGGTIFEDDFEAYTSGQQLACQNPADWTTWSNAPCGTEDAYISNLYAHSGTQSVVIVQNNDLVKDFGDPLTTGKYRISFYAYIPTGKTGYFNTLQSFIPTGTSIWGIEVFFNAAGAGSINANGTGTATFTWTPDTWFKVEHIIDLDSDHSEIWIGGSMIYSYQWSLGATGTGQNTLDANDFYGAAATDQMFVDDYELFDMAGAEWLFYHDGTFEDAFCSTSGGAGLAQVFVPASYPCTIQQVMYYNDVYGSYLQQNEVYVLTGDGATILGGPYYVSNAGAGSWVTVDIEDITITAGNFMVATYNTTAGGPYVGVDDSFYNGSLYFGNLGAFTELGEYGYYFVGSHEALVAYGAKSYNNVVENSVLLKPGQNTTDLSSMVSKAATHTVAYAPQPGLNNRALIGYNLYRDNELLTYTTELAYSDLGLASGTYDYTLTAVYDQGESEPIGPASVVILPAPILISATPDYYGIDLVWQDGSTMPMDNSKFAGYSTSDIAEAVPAKEAPVGVYDPTLYPSPKQGGETIATALAIAALPFSDQGTTTGYVNDYDEACPYTGSTAPDVVYSFVPTEDLLITISVCQSAYDTKLYVYENAYTPGNAYACNDDYASCTNWQSQLDDLFVQAGNTYYIVIDGYGTANGSYILDITGTPYVPCVVECPAGALDEGELCGEDVNGGCNMAAPYFTPIACGDTYCGTAWANGSSRDTDWYELVLNSPKTLTWTVTAEFPVYAFIINGNAGCAGLSIIAIGQGGPCETAIATTTVPPGTYWLWVGNQSYLNVAPCGNANSYVAQLTCQDAFMASYNIFRDGIDIADVYSGMTYRDEAIENGGTYCYTVSQVPAQGIETPQSNELCATVPQIPVMAINPLVLTETHVVPPAQTTTQVITVSNPGLGTLDWDLVVNLAPPADQKAPIVNQPVQDSPEAIALLAAREAQDGISAPSLGMAPNGSQIPAGYSPEKIKNGVRGEVAYGNNVEGSTFYSIDVSTLATTVIGSTTYSAFCGDFAPGDMNYMYIIDYNDNWLKKVDILTGIATNMVSVPCPMAASGGIWTELAIDKVTGIFYATATDIAQSNLYTIDPITGVITTVGNMGIAAVISCTIDLAGVMYAFDIVSDNMFTVNLATGAGTLLGPAGFNGNYAQGMGYDAANDLVYLAAYSTTAELRLLDKVTGATTLIGSLPGETGAFGFPYLGGPLPGNDVGVQSFISPVSGPDLGLETVKVRVKNFGTNAASNIPVSYTLDGGAPVSGTLVGPIAAGATADFTFPGTVDLSTVGQTYVFYGCTALAGDENPNNDCKTANVTNVLPQYCAASTSTEDEYIANVLCGDINNTSGWQGGVADYTAMSTQIDVGGSEPITVTNGNAWASDIVYCWVDWNNNYTFEQGGNEEFMLVNVGGTGETFTGAITVPAGTTGGDHRMRIRMTYSTAPTPCGSASYGEVEEYTITVGSPWLAAEPLSGTLAPGGSTDVTVTFNSTGLEFGTYEGSLVFASNDPVTPAQTVPAILHVVSSYSTISGTVTNALAKAPIEGVTIIVDELRGYTTTTLADGTYTVEVPEGVYTVTAEKTGYITASVSGVVAIQGQTVVQDFELEFAAPVMISADPDFYGVMVEWEANPALGYPYKAATQAYSLSNVAEKPLMSKEESIMLKKLANSNGVTYKAPQNPKQGGDNIGSAFVIPALPFTETGTTNGYLDDYNVVCPYTATGAPDVVYQFTPTSDMTISVSLCESLYDTKLYIFETDATTSIACNDDLCGTSGWRSQVTDVPLTAGLNYFIVVDGYSSTDYGTYTISVDGGSTGPSCETAIVAVEGLNTSPQAPYWFEFTPAIDGVVTVSSCIDGQSVDTDVEIYDACGGSLVAANDDYSSCASYGYSSTASFQGTAGVSYKIYWVDTWEASGFDFTITVTTCEVECPVGAIDEGELCGEDTNGGCNMDIPTFTPIAAGDVICGTAWADGTTRDTDWYELVLDAPKTITWSVTAEFPVYAFIIDGNYGCAGLSVIGIGMAGPCETAIATTTVPPGIYWLWVGNQSYLNINPCGDNNTYVAELTCEDAFMSYFNLYRDGQAFAQVYNTFFYDQQVTQGQTYCYTVDQVIQPGLVTGLSNELCATVPYPPVFTVNPASLEEVHPTTHTITTKVVTVMNDGLGALDWSLSVNTGMDYSVNVIKGSSNGNTTQPKSLVPERNSAPVNVVYNHSMNRNVLWSQMVPTADGLCASQDFEASFDVYDCNAADDFTVTSGPWEIGTVSFIGGYWNGTGPAAGFNIEFYNDAAGAPGSSIQYYYNLPFTAVPSGTIYIYTVSLPSALILPDGNYWISMQARMDYSLGGQFGLTPSTPPQVQAERMWINPGNGFGGGAITWVPGSAIWPTQVGKDWCFELAEPVVVVEPWLAANPLSGTLGAGESIEITVTFNSADIAEGTYTGSLDFSSNDPINPFVTVPVTLEVGVPMQDVVLPMGWSAWSSYINPNAKMTMAELLAPVVNNMVITQYFNQLYYPTYGINTLGDFTNAHGYVTKMTQESTLSLTGQMAEPLVYLAAGWNLMPILQECPIAAADVFSNLPGFIIAYEVGGNGIWYPAGGIYTLTTLMPGKAYWVKVSVNVPYSFPGCAGKSVFGNALPLRPENKTNWNDVSYTGLSHAVIFSENATSNLLLGDVLGAFTNDGTCAGMVEVSNSGAGFVVFGDDITTTAADGFIEGETMSYKLFRQATGEEFTVDVTYSTLAPNYDGNYAINGLSVINDLTLKSTGINNVDLGNLSIYPNPSTGIFNVVINDLDKDINYTIVNAQGQEVYEGKLLETQQIDLSAEPKGVYFIKFTNETVLRIEKLVIK